MTNYYRFGYGAYSDSGEEWFTHERTMTETEVAGLLREKWPEVRSRLAPLWEQHRIDCDAYRKKWDIDAPYSYSNPRPKPTEPWPRDPEAPDMALLAAAGFVELEPIQIDGDPLFDGWGSKIEQIDRELPKMGRRQ